MIKIGVQIQIFNFWCMSVTEIHVNYVIKMAMNEYQERIIHDISQNEYKCPEDLYGRDKSSVTFKAFEYYFSYIQYSSHHHQSFYKLLEQSSSVDIRLLTVLPQKD